MPSTIPPIDLSPFSVSQSGIIDLKPLLGGTGVLGSLATVQGKQATLRLHNDSGSGLQLALDASGQQFYMPAGGWQDCYPAPGDSKLTYTVVYVLPKPPVTLLMATFYNPGEPVPPMSILGNSPIAGGVTSSVTATNSIDNEGNSPLSQWLKVVPNDSGGLNTWFADTSGNLTVDSDNAGVLTQIFRLIAGASPQVQIGAVTALTAILGHLVMANNISIQAKDASGNAQDLLYTDASNTVNLQAAAVGGTINLNDGNGSSFASADPVNGIQCSLGAAFGHVSFFTGSIARVGTFTGTTGTGGGTFTHGLNNTPNWVGPICSSTSSSASQGVDVLGATTCHIIMGATVSFRAYAIR